jgi:hypothetical protein
MKQLYTMIIIQPTYLWNKDPAKNKNQQVSFISSLVSEELTNQGKWRFQNINAKLNGKLTFNSADSGN